MDIAFLTSLSPYDDTPAINCSRGVPSSSTWMADTSTLARIGCKARLAARHSLDKLIGFPKCLKSLAVYMRALCGCSVRLLLTELHLLSRLLGINPENGRLRALEWLSTNAAKNKNKNNHSSSSSSSSNGDRMHLLQPQG